MNCGSVNSHCCSKLCTPLRGKQQATQCVDTVAKMQEHKNHRKRTAEELQRASGKVEGISPSEYWKQWQNIEA